MTHPVVAALVASCDQVAALALARAEVEGWGAVMAHARPGERELAAEALGAGARIALAILIEDKVFDAHDLLTAYPSPAEGA